MEYGHVILLPCAVDGPLQFLDDRSLELEMLLRLAVEINNFALCLFYECSTPRTACPFFQVRSRRFMAVAIMFDFDFLFFL